MACKMLFFDYREAEENFFKENDFSNYDIKFFKESLNEETFKELTEDDIQNTMIISVFISSSVNEEIINKFKNLRVISTRSTGYDHIDLNSCVNKNIALINVSSYGDSSVAQFAFMLILMLIRNISAIIKSENNTSNFTGKILNNLTLGVVGTGIIGSSICHAGRCFGMKVLGYDLRENHELINNYGVEYVDLETLLEKSDIVSLHLPFTQKNYHMFSKEQFEKMKDGAYFVNVSRGELVDTKSLLEVAKTGKFGGIALDVVACADIECGENNKDKSSIMCVETSEIVKELGNLQNVIITPHIAYDTQESIDYILEVTFKGLADYLTGGRQYRVI